MLKAKVHELKFPDTTSMCPPLDKVNTKGAPKNGKKMEGKESQQSEKSHTRNM